MILSRRSRCAPRRRNRWTPCRRQRLDWPRGRERVWFRWFAHRL